MELSSLAEGRRVIFGRDISAVIMTIHCWDTSHRKVVSLHLNYRVVIVKKFLGFTKRQNVKKNLFQLVRQAINMYIFTSLLGLGKQVSD